MSWSISKTLKHEHSGVGLQKTLDELNAIDRTNIGNSQCIKERDEQVEAAIRTAFGLLADGCFVNAEEVSITLSGHANPEHQSSISGMSNEMISLTIAIKHYREQ